MLRSYWSCACDCTSLIVAEGNKGGTRERKEDEKKGKRRKNKRRRSGGEGWVGGWGGGRIRKLDTNALSTGCDKTHMQITFHKNQEERKAIKSVRKKSMTLHSRARAHTHTHTHTHTNTQTRTRTHTHITRRKSKSARLGFRVHLVKMVGEYTGIRNHTPHRGWSRSSMLKRFSTKESIDLLRVI